jgi:hypothetical protein
VSLSFFSRVRHPLGARARSLAITKMAGHVGVGLADTANSEDLVAGCRSPMGGATCKLLANDGGLVQWSRSCRLGFVEDALSWGEEELLVLPFSTHTIQVLVRLFECTPVEGTIIDDAEACEAADWDALHAALIAARFLEAPSAHEQRVEQQLVLSLRRLQTDVSLLKAAAAQLVNLLGDEAPPVRDAAATALRCLPASELALHIDSTIDFLRQRKVDEGIISAALLVLGGVANPFGVDRENEHLLLRLLDDDEDGALGPSVGLATELWIGNEITRSSSVR